jgi:hypothetical protein
MEKITEKIIATEEEIKRIEEENEKLRRENGRIQNNIWRLKRNIGESKGLIVHTKKEKSRRRWYSIGEIKAQKITPSTDSIIYIFNTMDALLMIESKWMGPRLIQRLFRITVIMKVTWKWVASAIGGSPSRISLSVVDTLPWDHVSDFVQVFSKDEAIGGDVNWYSITWSRVALLAVRLPVCWVRDGTHFLRSVVSIVGEERNDVRKCRKPRSLFREWESGTGGIVPGNELREESIGKYRASKNILIQFSSIIFRLSS